MKTFNDTKNKLVRTEHVCYFTSSSNFDEIILNEVVFEYHKHLDNSENNLIKTIKIYQIETLNRKEYNKNYHLILLEAAQNNILLKSLKEYGHESIL
jgi:hypothetical protein